MHEVSLAIFVFLMALVFVWFGLLKAIFSQLEKHHPEKYEQMGKPSLFWNNSMKTMFATLKFVCKREHKSLSNPTLSKTSDFALAVFVVYTVVFFGFFFGFFNMVQAPHAT